MTIRKVVITGPTGGVGNNLINELVSHNVEVLAVCRPKSKRIKSIPLCKKVRVIECELEDIGRLPELVNEKDFDVFYHFAWDGTFGAARDDIDLQEKNVKCTLDAVRAATDLGCKAFVGAGTQAEYGYVDGVLHPETVCKPVTGYGAAKLAAGVMSRVLCTQLGIRHNWCRILSLYGPYDGEKTMVMSMLGALLRKEKPKTTKGEQIWDYIYAKDVARAFRLVGERGSDGAVYCIGSGETRTLRQYIEAIRDAVDPTAEIDFGGIPYYPNQVMHLEADIANLTKDTGFIPEYTFEQGIMETIEWIRKTEEK